jgi:hypothetical protein
VAWLGAKKASVSISLFVRDDALGEDRSGFLHGFLSLGRRSTPSRRTAAILEHLKKLTPGR